MTTAGAAIPASPEMELLCSCVSPGRIPADPALRQVDWSRFLGLATNHHVLPLVHRALECAAQAGQPVPPEYRACLHRLCLSISASNLRATAILRRLQERLAAAGIRLVPVKGPALAALAYGDTALRQFEDLDLLVAREDVLRTVAALEQEGYVARELPPAASRSRYLAWLQDWSLHKPGDPLHLDLKPVLISHTLCGPASVDFMAQACQPVPVGAGAALLAPGPEAMLLAVCADGTNEMWGKVSSVADVAALLTAFPGADWSGLLRAAGRFGLRRSLQIGTWLAEILLACPRPEAFRAARRDPVAQRLAQAAARRIRAEESLHTGMIRQTLFSWRSRDRLRDRGRFLARLLFVPGAVELSQIALPERWYPLYSCLRPFRLAGDAWRGRSRRIVAGTPKQKP